MATLTFEDKQKNALIKKFHALLGVTGVGSDGKETMLAGYGVESTRDLDVAQLVDACNTLDMLMNPALQKLDKARKRLIASIGAYLRNMGVEQSIGKIKAIACRAAERVDFNDIPLGQLQSLYGAFTKAQKDLAQVEELTADAIYYLSSNN